MRPYMVLVTVAAAGLGLLPALSAMSADTTPTELDQARQPRLVMFETFQRPG